MYFVKVKDSCTNWHQSIKIYLHFFKRRNPLANISSAVFSAYLSIK